MKKGFYAGFALVAFSFCVANSVCIKSSNTVLDRDTDLIVLAKDGVSNEDLKNEIRSLVGFNYRVLSTYDGIANGIRIKVNSNYVSSIKRLNGVECACINATFEVSQDTVSEYYDSDAYYTASQIKNSSKETMNVPTSSKEGEGTFLAVIDNGLLLNHTAFTDLDSSTTKRVSKNDIKDRISSTGFAAEKGKNKNIDDYYYNSKIVYYYDYGNGDHDVYSQFGSHGMHTSSTAVANGDFKGIAPKAQLAFLKVGEDSSTGSSITHDALINAFNDCYYLGVDAISFSIGSALDESGDEDIITILNRLEDNDVIINVAAGNDGKGNWSGTGAYANFLTTQVETGVLGSYATYDSTTVVAAGVLDSDSSAESVLSVNGTILTGYDQCVDRKSSSTTTTFTPQKPFHSLIPSGEDAVALEYVVVPGLGESKDYQGIDVKGKIALIQRGSITFADKVKNAMANGAVACIIGNGEGLGSSAYFELSEINTNCIPTYGVGLETYNWLKEEENKVVVITKDQMTSFSSDGALGSLSIKPEILSPGQNIIGAVSDDKVNNRYQYYDGTSMATPNYSGSVMLALGEYKATSEEDRLAYAKTLKNRFMSTANPVFQSTDIPTSVRRQGAGMVDVSGAINSKVYLKGTNDEAKVELKNNDNVKKGLLDFDVTFVNDKKVSGSYTPTLYVTVPETVELDSETYPTYKGVKFQSTNQRLVKKVQLSEVKLDGSSEQKYHVSYQISENDLNEILGDYPDGIQVEGYVIFEPKTSSLEELSIPYLGFVGDYTKGEVVEPFQFEKEDGKLYTSDLLNSVLQDNVGLTNANFSSYFGVTTGGLSAIEMEPIYKHQKNIEEEFLPINATLESDGKYHLKAGNVGSADTLYIQQFVNRSVLDNTITMTNSKGMVVLTDHMFDLVHSSGSDSATQPLTKTCLVTSLLTQSSGYVASSRAYTIIPLKDKKNDAYYEDGNYNIEFSYTLMDGSVQTKEYVLEISSSNEDYNVESISTSSDELVLNFTTNMAKVTIGDIEGTKRSAKQFAFKKSDLKAGDVGYTFKAVSESYSVSYGSITKDFSSAICSSSLKAGVQTKITSKENSDGSVSLTIGVYDKNGSILKLDSAISVSYYIGDVAEAHAFDSKGSELESTLDNGYIKFKTTDKKVTLTFSNGTTPSKDNSGIVIGALCGVLAIGVVTGVAICLIKVLKGKKKN